MRLECFRTIHMMLYVLAPQILPSYCELHILSTPKIYCRTNYMLPYESAAGIFFCMWFRYIPHSYGEISHMNAANQACKSDASVCGMCLWEDNINESCHTWMSHVRLEWVMSRIHDHSQYHSHCMSRSAFLGGAYEWVIQQHSRHAWNE